jgi:hypothetical protein
MLGKQDLARVGPTQPKQNRVNRADRARSVSFFYSPTLPAALPSSHHFFNSLPISPLSVVIGFFLRSSSLGPPAKAARTAVVRTSVLNNRIIFSPPSLVGSSGDCRSEGGRGKVVNLPLALRLSPVLFFLYSTALKRMLTETAKYKEVGRLREVA